MGHIDKPGATAQRNGARGGAGIAALVAGTVLALTGCGARPAPTVVLAQSCEPVSGSEPARISIQPAVSGTVRVLVEQRGISTVGHLAHGPSAQSPADRFGVFSFVEEVGADDTLQLQLESRDSPEISGEACVSAALIDPAGPAVRRGERALAEASIHVRAGKYEQAFAQYLEAARAFDRVDRVRAAQARHAMSELAYGKLGREADAWWLARDTIAGFGSHASPAFRSTLLMLEARTTLESTRFGVDERRARVFELLDEAERLARQEAFGARELPRLDILRGFMEYHVGRPEAASRYFAKAAAECETLRDWECYARARQNSASLAEEARNYTVALEAYGQALERLPPHLDPQLTANIWGNLGRLQGSAGLIEQSQRSHRTSIRLHADINDCEGARVGIARLGTLFVQVGSIADGVDALSSAASLDCPRLIEAARGDFEAAPAPAGTICTELPDVASLNPSGRLAVFNALLGLREALRLDDREADARRCLLAARAFATTPRTKLRLANAEGASLLNESATRAAETFRSAIDQADAAGLPANNEHRSIALLGLARAALLGGNPALARRHAERSLAMGMARADIGQVVDSLQLMAGASRTAGQTDEAIDVLQVAAGLADQVPIDDLDPEKRATWLATQHAVFAELTALFARAAAGNESLAWRAFEVSERGRARSLRHAVSQTTGEHEAGPEPSVRYRELMRRISELAPRGGADEAGRVSLDALQALAGADTESPAGETKVSVQRVLASLRSTAVEYAIGPDEMYAFVVDGERMAVVPLGSREEIARHAANLHDRLRNPESARADVQRAAARLAALVLWPVVGHIRTERVIFIPDDSLHTVPFSILPWTKEPDAPLLIERVEPSVAPSTLLVAAGAGSRKLDKRNGRFELIGDAIFRTSEWKRRCASGSAPDDAGRDARSMPRLPGSRQEVMAIAQLARRTTPSRDVRLHLGCEATPSVLKAAAASSPALLHVATHGTVDAFRPRLSALELSPETKDEGRATSVGLLDILDMRTRSQLVVLSACDTSRGRLLPGEGVLGPAQAFLQAGAATVIASYWRIPDERTAAFMEAFYRYLLVDRLSAAAALRRTQLDSARDRDTHDWAAFTLYGWPDTSL